MMQNFTQAQLLFENYLAKETFKSSPANLYDPCKHIVALGGKRIRPVCVLMAIELFTAINEDAFHSATAIELFHNFTLIHDDIMDNAPLRRGKQTVHEKWNMPTAILSGDVMNVYAYQHLCNVTAQYLPAILHTFNTTAIEVCEGQQMDMDFEARNDVSIDEYITMITLKTSVLLACAFKMGAIIGGATDGPAQILYDFGKNLGISFQLKDDYLDAYGTSEKIGKQIGGDILSNKKTFLYLKAKEKANEAQAKLLEDLLQYDGTDKVEKTMQLFLELDIETEITKAKEYYSQLAYDCLEKLPVQDSKKTELRNLAEYLLGREK
jgi:geranylgeranyl diphosphate synthase, type II